MFCIVYVYAVAGVTIYGGLITRDKSSIHYQKIASTAYSQVCLDIHKQPSSLEPSHALALRKLVVYCKIDLFCISSPSFSPVSKFSIEYVLVCSMHAP
jgi:hypothetical protein